MCVAVGLVIHFREGKCKIGVEEVWRLRIADGESPGFDCERRKVVVDEIAKGD